MACVIDFRPMTAADRRMAALTAMRDGGVDRLVSVAYQALSEGETQGIWTMPRPDGSDCCRTPVGVETVWFHDAVASDDRLLNWLASKGWVDVGQDQKLKPIGAIANPLNQDAIAEFFEKSVATGNRKAVNWAALGPTQLNIHSEGACSVPVSIQDVWDMYLAGDPAQMLLLHNYYNTPQGYQANWCPEAPPLPQGDEEGTITWLHHHTGGPRDYAVKVYFGDDQFIPGRKPYKDSWADAWAASQQVWG